MVVINPERKIKNNPRKGKYAKMMQKTLEAIVSLPSVMDHEGHIWKDAPIVERAELSLASGSMVAYVKGLYLDFGEGLCIVCNPYDSRSGTQEEERIPLSRVFTYNPLISDDD